MPVSHDTLFIGGEWVSPSSPARIAVRNASTEEPAGEAPEAAEADVDAAVAAARRAFDDPAGWSQWEPARRGEALERLAAELGGRPAGLDAGWFVEPTVFADVDNGSTIAQEEIFGPVLSVIEYTDTDDAIRIANDSDYGLGGSVWTTDRDRARAVVRRVRTGTMGINGYLPDPAGPWGGVKSSGIGRELGPGALAAYQNLKTVYA